MSRFFAASDSDIEDESGDEGQIEQEAGGSRPAQNFYLGYDSSDDEPTSKRVVRSQKDKKWEELQSTTQSISDHISANDWNSIHNDYEKLQKQVTKAQNVIAKEGIPRFYIKTLVELEDFLKTSLESKDKKKMNALNLKALNTMKQKLKKNNKAYETDIEEYRKNPDVEEAEDEEEAAEAEEAEEQVQEEAEDEAEEPEEKDTGLGDYSDEDDGPQYVEEKPSINKWLKKDKDDDKKGKKPDDSGKKPDDSGKRPEKKPKKEAVRDTEESRDTQGPALTPDVELDEDQLNRKIKEITPLLGKKATDRNQLISDLTILEKKVHNAKQHCEVLIHLISALFNLNATLTTHMPIDKWLICQKYLKDLLNLVKSNPDMTVEEHDLEILPAGTTSVNIKEIVLSFIERLDDELLKSLQFIDPHTQEYVQRLQHEPLLLDLIFIFHEWCELVKETALVGRISLRLLEHLYYKNEKIHKPDEQKESSEVGEENKEDKKETPSEEKKEDKEEEKKEEKKEETKEEPKEEKKEDEVKEDSWEARFTGKEEEPESLLANLAVLRKENDFLTGLKPARKEEISTLIQRLSAQIYKYGDERSKARAVLCHIYYLALSDHFYSARDMILMSHLQDNIHNADILTQILFNRAMVQLGLCAFRQGLIQEAHSALSEICAGGKVKELLAQGTSAKHAEKPPEQEKLEKRRQIPFHMHINLELLECIHLTTAMLLEVPNMAANPYDSKKKLISRSFRRLLDYADRQVFSGPPENTRDFVLASAKALAKGDWRTSLNRVLTLKIWDLCPNVDNVKAMLKRKIQEEGLRTYLFSYSNFYTSLSLAGLSEMFELPQSVVHAIVSKMMINDELHGSWDQPTGSIVMHNVEPSRLQYLALQFAEKAVTFVENNERLLDTRTGFGFKVDFKSTGKDRWQDNQGDKGFRQRYNNKNRSRQDNQRNERNERNERSERNERNERNERGGNANSSGNKEQNSKRSGPRGGY